MDHYDGNLTMREALAVYWEANGFGDDGGYNKDWDWFKLGPLTLPIPNPQARKDAIKFHDMHHVVTGYATDWRGEFEIAGWETARGCGRLWVGWALNLGGMAAGLLLMPRRVIAAFMRGRAAENLYAPERQVVADTYADKTVDEVRAELGVDRPVNPTREDWLALWGYGALAMLWGLVQLTLVLAPVAVLLAWLL